MKTSSHPHIRLLLALAAGLIANVLVGANSAPRERLLMDFDWRFHLGNDWGIAQNLAKSGTGMGPASVAFCDASWRRVDLPHDWAIELPFDAKADTSHGFRAVGGGFQENSIGWYRRTFELSATDSGRRLWLEFDGAFRDCTVFVNGWFVGHHESGYSGVRYDITDVANCGGKNVVAVRVDASQFEGWFYEGAGIYRHVWLVKTAPLAIAPDGVFVFSRFKDNIPEGPAEIHLETRLANAQNEAADATVTWEIAGSDGKMLATTSQTGRIAAAAAGEVEQTTKIAAPELWSPETPKLYRLVTTVASGGQIVDRIETEFGVRTVAFDANRGFLLNGKPYLLKGTCNHQDHAGVGAALPDRLQYFRIAKLKEMGGNAYRTSHNSPTPELLEACDRLGMLVMDENRLLGSDALHLKWFEEQIRRDRNHPSVAIWSLANEEFTTQGTPDGGRVAATMQTLAKRLDPTRPVTYNAPVGNEFPGINSVIEVRGWSYHIGVDNMDAYHTAHPQQPNVGSEQGSTVGTRGIYTDDKERGYVSAYDDHGQSWSNTAEEWVGFFDSRPWLSGGFVWTGFDYRGEPTPYGWPCINSHFGILDTCGFPKDNYWYYQSWWMAKPVLHLLPHWNWSGREGQEIDVRALSNCEEVEVFLNGRSFGRQTLKRTETLKWKVPYAPGTLSAKGFKAGQLVAETKVETTGAPVAVQLAPDRATIEANGEDVSVITVAVADAQGHVVPVADNAVSFELEGAGRIIGVGNGDPSCHEPDVFIATVPLRTVPVGGWRWKKLADTYAKNLPETGASLDDSGWEKADVTVESGPLGVHEQGVFRTRFTVSAQDLAAPAVELYFGKIEGDGKVFVNGQQVGSAGDPRAASSYDVKSFLHPGENTIAVTVANYGAAAGVNKGVCLRLPEAPLPVAWKRSVFNGLDQIIVQASKEGGPLKLTARSTGLLPATISLEAKPAPARPALP
jgi:beta-galactosidase